MDWKTALTNSLLAFFAATLVVLIAHSLDVNSASRMEGQLERIGDELEMLRKQLGGATEDERLIVYYFHGDKRCETCNTIETTAHDLVTSEYAEQLASEVMTWKVVNYQKPGNEHYKTEFELAVPTVVIARTVDGELVEFTTLNNTWGLVDNTTELRNYIRDSIESMLPEPSEEIASEPEAETPDPVIDSTETLPIPLDILPIPDDILPIPGEEFPILEDVLADPELDLPIPVEVSEPLENLLPIPEETLPLPEMESGTDIGNGSPAE